MDVECGALRTVAIRESQAHGSGVFLQVFLEHARRDADTESEQDGER